MRVGDVFEKFDVIIFGLHIDTPHVEYVWYESLFLNSHLDDFIEIEDLSIVLNEKLSWYECEVKWIDHHLVGNIARVDDKQPNKCDKYNGETDRRKDDKNERGTSLSFEV